MNDPVKIINEDTALSLSLQNALGYAIPSVIPFRTIVTVKDDSDGASSEDGAYKALPAANYISPVTLYTHTQKEADGFTLPIDPIISISGKNIITRRTVSKHEKRGSIKERWSQDDWEITIAGVLTTDDTYSVYQYMKMLRETCENGTRGLSIKCPVLNNYFEINRIAIDSFDFPFTQGEDNQEFTIKAYSDESYSLLVDESVTK